MMKSFPVSHSFLFLFLSPHVYVKSNQILSQSQSANHDVGVKLENLSSVAVISVIRCDLSPPPPQSPPVSVSRAHVKSVSSHSDPQHSLAPFNHHQGLDSGGGGVTTRLLPVIGGHHEVEQQPDGLLHIDLVGGGQPLVELVVDGRQDGLQPRHIDLSVVVQCVEAVVAKGFDHVPDVHQMNCEGGANGHAAINHACLRLGCFLLITTDYRDLYVLLRLHLFCTNRSLQAVL